LTENEFRQKYRVSRKSFDTLLGLVKNHPVFLTSSKTGHPQASPATQLMIFLKYLGTGGSGNSIPDLRDVFKIGRGTGATLSWPRYDCCFKFKKTSNHLARQRRATGHIKENSKRKGIFPNCIGFIDGTLFPLAFCPNTKDAPDYSGRKHSYSLSVLIINDDQCMIRYYLSGWPGSSHDNQIWCNSDVYQRPHEYFSERQYLLGDSAFENSWFMVTSYKCPKGMELGRTEEIFNAALAKPLISAEHTIGMLKGRFPWLRSIRMKITEKKKV
jgi:DDE superfamily endonuclease